jgi:creatinine amidohydrolase
LRLTLSAAAARGPIDMARLRVLFILGLVFAGGANAQAPAPAPLFLEELTWSELRDDINAGMTTIVVPIGGTEQNGPHMALGKHNVRVKVLSERIARILGNALVAPVIAYVPEGGFDSPTGHMRFPGTISVSEDAFEQVLDGAARSFKLHGFHDIVFLGDHGGTQHGEKMVADRLNREWTTTPVRVHAVEEYYLAGEDEFQRVLTARGYPADEVGKHAGLADTSLMLAIDPRLVRADRLHSTANANGVNGDPARASSELGQLAVDAIVTKTVAAIRQTEKRP